MSQALSLLDALDEASARRYAGRWPEAFGLVLELGLAVPASLSPVRLLYDLTLLLQHVHVALRAGVPRAAIVAAVDGPADDRAAGAAPGRLLQMHWRHPLDRRLRELVPPGTADVLLRPAQGSELSCGVTRSSCLGWVAATYLDPAHPDYATDVLACGSPFGEPLEEYVERLDAALRSRLGRVPADWRGTAAQVLAEAGLPVPALLGGRPGCGVRALEVTVRRQAEQRRVDLYGARARHRHALQPDPEAAPEIAIVLADPSGGPCCSSEAALVAFAGRVYAWLAAQCAAQPGLVDASIADAIEPWTPEGAVLTEAESLAAYLQRHPIEGQELVAEVLLDRTLGLDGSGAPAGCANAGEVLVVAGATGILCPDLTERRNARLAEALDSAEATDHAP